MEDEWEESQNLDSKIKSQEIKLKAACVKVTKLEKVLKFKKGKFKCKACDYKTSSEKKHKNEEEKTFFPFFKIHKREPTCGVTNICLPENKGSCG